MHSNYGVENQIEFGYTISQLAMSPTLNGNIPMTETTRFAPSPTGYLHLGHAFSALFAAKYGNRFLVRMEDIDTIRCRPEFDQAILEDLDWLGLEWELPIRRQSAHMNDYGAALDKLNDMNLLYPCFCTRSDIRREINSSGYAPHSGPDGFHYPGTCRHLDIDNRKARIDSGKTYALRLDMSAALQHVGRIKWRDLKKGVQTITPEIFGDVILARKDTPTSYHLSVTVDDHHQGISLITRGEDLFSTSHIHCLLQFLLGYQTPNYLHHPLIMNEDGKRFAKRNQGATLRDFRCRGVKPVELRKQLGFN